MQQSQLGFLYGFKATGLNAGNPFYEVAASYPAMSKYYGILSGPGFSLSYATCAILWGKLINKCNRKQLISLVCIGWSLTTIMQGQINSFGVFVLMRVLLGVF